MICSATEFPPSLKRQKPIAPSLILSSLRYKGKQPRLFLFFRSFLSLVGDCMCALAANWVRSYFGALRSKINNKLGWQQGNYDRKISRYKLPATALAVIEPSTRYYLWRLDPSEEMHATDNFDEKSLSLSLAFCQSENHCFLVVNLNSSALGKFPPSAAIECRKLLNLKFRPCSGENGRSASSSVYYYYYYFSD